MTTNKPKLTKSGDNHYFIRNKDSDRLVIFFTGTRAEKTPGYFNFWLVGHEVKANILFINNGRAEWYQGGIPSIANSFAAVVSEIEALQRYLGVKKVFTIGQSMGGFGAIRYGEALGADILAVGTETRLCIPASRSELRLPGDVHIEVPDILPVLANHKNRAVLLAGENDPVDMFSLTRVSKLRNLEITSYRNVEHSVFSQFKEDGQLLVFLERFLNGEQLLKTGTEGSAWQSSQFNQAFYRQHRVFLKSNWLAVLEQGEIAFSISPENAHVRYMMAYAQSALRKDNAALENAKFSFEKCPDNLKYKSLYALCLRKKNRFHESIVLHKEILDENDALISSHYEIAASYFSLQNYEAVIEHCQKALVVSPGYDRCLKLLQRAKERLSLSQ